MVSNGISVVQVNPYAVKQTKELEDNSQRKDDRKAPKLITNLVKDGNYGMLYLLEKVYAELRRLSMFREQLTEDRNRNMNHLHREMKIYFPEYKDAFGRIDGVFCMAVRWFAEKIMELDEEIAEVETRLNEKCNEILHAENVLEIPGIGGKTLFGSLAEMGDISRFDDVKELQKLSGVGLVSCSSGKHKGETRISHRGRKRLRYCLF